MTSNAEHPAIPRQSRGRESLEQQARRKGLRPLTSLDELEADVWESDEELQDFLSFVSASRRSDLA